MIFVIEFDKSRLNNVNRQFYEMLEKVVEDFKNAYINLESVTTLDRYSCKNDYTKEKTINNFRLVINEDFIKSCINSGYFDELVELIIAYINAKLFIKNIDNNINYKKYSSIINKEYFNIYNRYNIINNNIFYNTLYLNNCSLYVDYVNNNSNDFIILSYNNLEDVILKNNLTKNNIVEEYNKIYKELLEIDLFIIDVIKVVLDPKIRYIIYNDYKMLNKHDLDTLIDFVENYHNIKNKKLDIFTK